jgi:predicted metallo-beta-lactamase superfamily hydrolase
MAIPEKRNQMKRLLESIEFMILIMLKGAVSENQKHLEDNYEVCVGYLIQLYGELHEYFKNENTDIEHSDKLKRAKKFLGEFKSNDYIFGDIDEVEFEERLKNAATKNR